MRTFLFITPHFPPADQLGAKRALNLVRHLPDEGWRPIVLAAPSLTGGQDPTLLELVPGDTIVSRGFSGLARPLVKPLARFFSHTSGSTQTPPPKRREPKPHADLGWRRKLPYLTPLDQYVWDVGGAYRSGARLIEEHQPSLIVANADPWSGLLVGSWLARRFDLPFVPDLRDPWTTNTAKMALRPTPTQAVIRRLERGFFDGASQIILNTRSSRNRYREAYSGLLPPERFTHVRNAFDPEFYYPGVEEGFKGFSVHHFGSLRWESHYRVLMEGFARFLRKRRVPPEGGRLVIYGDLPPKDEALVHGLGIADHIYARPPVPMREALRFLIGASVLALVEGPDRSLIVPAKLFDYLAAERPILAVTDSPEIGSIIRECGAGRAVSHGDPEDVSTELVRFFDTWESGEEAPVLDRSRFGARAQAGRFAAILEDALQG
ncbi:glycosyltransferase [Gemmatimonadota bacterium]